MMVRNGFRLLDHKEIKDLKVRQVLLVHRDPQVQPGQQVHKVRQVLTEQTER